MSIILPFEKKFSETQDWNDPRYRSSYYQFGLLGHNGKDYATPIGTKIIAPHDGTIVESAYDAYGYGWYVKIENDQEGSILAHFKEKGLEVGKRVKQGDLVGLSGNSGNSTGAHLHWGYYRLPRKRDNGFSGTIDQTHWLILEDGWDIVDEQEEIIEGLRASRDDWKEKYGNALEVLKEYEKKDDVITKLRGDVKGLSDENERLKSLTAESMTVGDLFTLLLEKVKKQWQS